MLSRALFFSPTKNIQQSEVHRDGDRSGHRDESDHERQGEIKKNRFAEKISEAEINGTVKTGLEIFISQSENQRAHVRRRRKNQKSRPHIDRPHAGQRRQPIEPEDGGKQQRRQKAFSGHDPQKYPQCRPRRDLVGGIVDEEKFASKLLDFLQRHRFLFYEIRKPASKNDRELQAIDIP